jgi:signal transduction histidine kinase
VALVRRATQIPHMPAVPPPPGRTRLARILEWIAPAEGPPVEAWRRRIFAAALLGLVAFGLIAYVPTIIFAIAARETPVIFVDTLFMLFMIGALLARGMPFRLRAWSLVLVVGALGVFFLFGYGFSAAGFPWLMAFPIVAAVLLGLRVAIGVLGITALILITIGALIPTGRFPWASTMPPGMPPAEVMFTIDGLSVMMLAALLALAIGVLLEGLGSEAEARALAEAESARLGAAIEQSDGLVVLLDADGSVRYMNERARASLGEYPGAVLAPYHQAALAGASWAGTLETTMVDGSPLALSGTISPVRDASGAVRHLLATLRDVGHERALERRVAEASKLEAIGTLAGGIAHDFNNLLQPMVLNTEAVQAQLPPSHAVQPLLEDIRQSAAHARTLVRRILTFARGTSHERRALDLGALVGDAERLLRTSLPPGVRLRTELAPAVHVVAEPGELQQVLLNLSTNAVHAMPAGGDLTLQVARVAVTDDEALLVAFDGVSEVALLTVRDTGSGMDAATLARAFEPFFSTKGPQRGTGLGLAMVHGTVTALGGVVLPTSTPGGGTTMRVALPLARHLEEPLPPSPHVAPPARHRRALLVDDDAAVLAATARVLERLGWAVTCHDRPQDALARLTAEGAAWDCLITDLSMPGMTGAELADAVHARHPTLPIVLATGYLEAESSDHLARPSIRHVLTKPFSSADLQRALDALVPS